MVIVRLAKTAGLDVYSLRFEGRSDRLQRASGLCYSLEEIIPDKWEMFAGVIRAGETLLHS